LINELAALGEEEGATSEQPLWDEPMGPRHVKRYGRVSEKNQARIPPTLASVQQLFSSKVFEGYLKAISSLSVLSANTETRMFKKGDYTLLHDHALEKNGLDVVFSFPYLPGSSATTQEQETSRSEWDESWGAGATHYVADKANLLTLYPKHNTLTMVLRDEGTLRFVRYLNARVGEARRRELSALYIIRDDDDEEEEEEEEGKVGDEKAHESMDE
jgi:hypothetical protein